MQSLSKIPVLTAANFKDFKPGDLFKRENSERVYVFIKYFDYRSYILIKVEYFDRVIENFILTPVAHSDFLHTHANFLKISK